MPQPTYEELLAMYYKNNGGEPTNPLKETEDSGTPNPTPDIFKDLFGQGQEQPQPPTGWHPPLKDTVHFSSPDGTYKDMEEENTEGDKAKKNFWEQLANNPYAQSGAHLGIEDRFKMAGSGAAAGGTAGKITAIAGITSGALGAARNFMSGYSLQKEGDRTQQEYLKNIKRANESNYQYTTGKDGGRIVLFEDGGMLNLAPEKQALDEYIAALPKAMHGMANAEIEKNEYVIEPDGSVKKAIGEVHEKGGIKQFLQDGTRIVSDNLKIGKEVAEIIANRTGIKTKPNDTFAKVIDKYSDSIGLTNLNKEAEDAHKALKENQNIKDEQTRNINQEFLKEKLQEVETKRQTLLKNRLNFTDLVYKAQEINKMPSYRHGGVHIDPNMAAIFKKNNISMEEGLKILQGFQEGGEMEQGYNQMGSTDAVVMVNPETGDVAEVTTQEEFEQLSAMGYLTEEEYSMMLQQQEQQGMQQQPPQEEQFKKGGEKVYSTYEDGGIKEVEKLLASWETEPTYEYKFDELTLPKMKDRLMQAMDSWGIDYNKEEIAKANKQQLNTYARKMQESVDSDIVKDFGTRIAPTKAGLIELSKLTDEQLKSIVKDENLISKIKGAKSGSFKALSEKERNTLTNNLKENKDKLPDSYAKSNFIDGEWFFRYPSVKEVKFGSREEYEGYIEQNKNKAVKDGVFSTDKDGLYIKPMYTESNNSTTDNNESLTENNVKPLDITQLQKPRSRITAPSPFNLPPPALQPHATVTYRPEYIDPMAISHEPMQQALLNQQANLMDRAGDLPIGMAGAFAATVGANTSEQINKAVIETEKYNASNRQQTETINAQKSDMTEMQRIQEIPRYERLALTALAKTQNDVYNYFNTQTRNAQKKHQYLNNAQLIDSLFEKAYYDPTAGEVKVGANDKFTYPNSSQTTTDKDPNKN